MICPLNNKIIYLSTALITGSLTYFYYYKKKEIPNEIITNQDKIDMYNFDIKNLEINIKKLKESLKEGDKKLQENQQKYDNNNKKTPFDTEYYEAERTKLHKIYKSKELQIENQENLIESKKNRIKELTSEKIDDNNDIEI